jgi:hypothetical protein
VRRLVPPTLALVVLGCAPPTPPHRPASKPDKRELFGDASLVPTREGERIRRELAQADELERLLARADVPASVTVSLVEPASAVVVARTGELAMIQTIAHAALPELEASRIHVTVHRPPIHVTAPSVDAALEAESDERRELPALVLTLGLGLALGIALERGWQRQR